MEDLFIKKILPELTPWAALILVMGWVVWRDFFKVKLNNGLNTENNFNTITLRVFEDLAKQIPLLKDTLHNTTILQAELAAKFEEQRQDQKLQNSDLKILDKKLDLIYKQNTDYKVIFSEKLEVIEKKIDNLIGNKKDPAPLRAESFLPIQEFFLIIYSFQISNPGNFTRLFIS